MAAIAVPRRLGARRELFPTARREADRVRALILDAALDSIITVDARGLIEDFNPAASRLFGYRREEVLGRHLVEVILPPRSRSIHKRALGRYLSTGEPRILRVDIEAQRDDGTMFPAELAVTQLDVLGRPSFTAYVRDVSQRVSAERRLVEADKRYRELVESLPVVVYEAELGADSPRYVSPQIENLLGFAGTEWLRDPKLWLSQIHVEDRGILADHERALRQYPTGKRVACEYRMLTKSGRTVWVRDEAVGVPGDEGAPPRVRGVIVDITARKDLEAKLSRHAYYDTLTGLPNRDLFMERLQRAIGRGPRRADGVIAVLFIDVDDFKAVNDTLGHSSGDALLAEIGSRLDGIIRPVDIAARFGGDEFIVLLDDLHSPAEALQVAARIGERLAEPVVVGHRRVHVTISIGIGVTSDPSTGADELVTQADIAMYRAKQSGKARAELFDAELSAEAWRRLDLQRDLRHAVERGQLIVHYQPVVGLASGALEHVEALVRWIHPERGLIMPVEFITLAESSGFITEIDRFVLHEACRQLAAWRERFVSARTLTVAVNLSPRDFRHHGLADEVTAALGASGLPGSCLTIEVTENGALIATDSVRDIISRMTRAGVRVVIDDFGIGYSGLDYFKRFKVHGLKIDRSFVAGVTKKREDAAIVTAALAFGGALGLTVVAEGIETVEQLDRLRELGCTAGQGFLLARPGPPSAIEAMLRERESN